MAEDYPFGLEELNKEMGDELEPGEELSDEDFEEIKIEGLPSGRPSFPLITFTSSALIDVFNIFTLGFLGIITGVIAIIIIRIYLIGKYGFIKRWVWKRAMMRLGVKSIPVLGPFLLSWSFFVLRAHSKNYKRIDQILTAAEKLIIEGARA